jgi:hypothetical protein
MSQKRVYEGFLNAIFDRRTGIPAFSTHEILV